MISGEHHSNEKNQTREPLGFRPMDDLPVCIRRGPLTRALRAIAEGQLNVGFIGGSITAGWEGNWPGPLMAWLAGAFPRVAMTAENAAIGATGSDSACLRVDHEIIERGCHLTFVEYAVNDFGKDRQRNGRTQEGLIRKLLAVGQDVVLVYTYRKEWYQAMIDGQVPETIADLERLARHYNLSSVWAGLYGLREVCAGHMKWDEWLPDGLHPGPRGSASYAQSIIEFLRQELTSTTPAPDHQATLPEPLFVLNWQSAHILPLTHVRCRGPWVLKRLHGGHHVEQVLETQTPGAQLYFEFTGRGLALIFDYGKKSAEFRYRLDGGEWIPIVRDRPDWCGDRGLVRALPIADDLHPGTHTFEMETCHGNRPDCTGTECRLGVIGVL